MNPTHRTAQAGVAERIPVYRDYVTDRTGWFFGLTGPQLTVIVVTGLPALLALDLRAWWGLACWLPIWCALIAAVVLPVRGWPAARWLAVWCAHALGARAGWTSWQSNAAAGTATDLADTDLPGVLAGLQIHDGPPFGPAMVRVAVIQDHAARTWAAVARISHPGIGLAEPAAREGMAAGLARLHEIAARSELIDLIAIQVRTVPDDGAERADWVRLHRDPDAPPLARQVTSELSQRLLPGAVRTETFVTVVVGEARIARSAKQAAGVEGRARVLHSALTEVAAQLRGPVGATQLDWLDTPALASVIRTGFAPGDRAGLIAADLTARHHPTVATSVPIAAAGPTTAHSELRQYRHDAWCSITNTILLPAQGAILGALAPVLVPTEPGERRCLTVYYSALSQRRADKLTERDQLSAALGSELRRRTGRLERARQRRAGAQVTRMDDTLAAGRALVRCAAAVTVTVPAGAAIAEHGRRLDASIRLAGFIPQRLDGAQDAAFAAAAIPLGIGLPRRRGHH